MAPKILFPTRQCIQTFLPVIQSNSNLGAAMKVYVDTIKVPNKLRQGSYLQWDFSGPSLGRWALKQDWSPAGEIKDMRGGVQWEQDSLLLILKMEGTEWQGIWVDLGAVSSQQPLRKWEHQSFTVRLWRLPKAWILLQSLQKVPTGCTPCFQPVIPRAQNTTMPRPISDLQNCELIKGCCFKPLSLGSLTW